MTRFKLLLRTLSHFRLANLAVIAGMAVASAILTGALMVGDSVKLSLRDLALQRLGPIDYSLTPGRFFPQDLAARIKSHPEFKLSFDQCIPGIYLRGGAANENSNSRAASVQIAALAGDTLPVTDAHCILNEPLASLLRIAPGRHTLILSLPSADETPKDATLARRSRDDSLTNMRLDVERVAAEPGLASLFTLTGSQRPTLNLWTNFQNLQQALDQPKGANAIFVSANPSTDQIQSLPILNKIIKEVAGLDDYSLSLAKSAGTNELVLNPSTTYISPAIDRAATAAAEKLKIPLRKVSVYLINSVTNVGSASADRTSPSIHYAIAAGISDIDGQPLLDDQIALNQYAAERLKARPGDKIRLSYFKRQTNGELVEVTSERLFTLTKILPMQGLGADPSLTPNYKGLTDAASMSNWDAPAGLEINKRLITPDDEAYWKKYRAAPKLFLSLNSAQNLWGSTFGDINSIRLPANRADEFKKELLAQIEPARMGLSFIPIKSQQLAAATSGTDFAELFVSFSFFVIAAAAILLAMLFRLSVEQRARGSLDFFGRWDFLQKVSPACPGRGNAALVHRGDFRPDLRCALHRFHHVRTAQLVDRRGRHHSGDSAHFADDTGHRVHLKSVHCLLLHPLVHRRLSTAHSANLLSGSWDLPAASITKTKFAPILAIAFLIPALGLLILGIINKIPQATAFLSAGSLLLISALAATAIILRLQRHPDPHLSIASLGLRNAARRRARSIMTVALIAFASFTLVTVASMKATPPRDTSNKKSGTGGYQLILTADHPLLGDLNTKKGRDLLGIGTRIIRSGPAKFTAMRTGPARISLSQPHPSHRAHYPLGSPFDGRSLRIREKRLEIAETRRC